MFIKHTNYGEGVYEISLSERADNLGLGAPFFGNVDLHCNMDKSHHQIILDCSIKATAKLTCDRCGTEFEDNLENEFKLFFLFDQPNDYEDNDDVFYLTPEQDKLELDHSVRDYTILSVPLKLLCKEDCKGLCAKCGTNLNKESCNCENEIINPVWEKLKELKK